MSKNVAKIRVLIIDDSVVVRRMISDILAKSADIEVVGTAASGKLGLLRAAQLNPDVITLDVEMPEMNGLDVLRRLRISHANVPVIMCSALTDTGASATLQALEIGAADCMLKPSSNGLDLAQFEFQLQGKIRGLGQMPRAIGQKTAAGQPLGVKSCTDESQVTKRTSPSRHFQIVAIGSSTGGPNALQELIPRLPANLPVPVVVTQHMPPIFTRMLAERLDKVSPLKVIEASNDLKVEAGTVYIAAGDFHLAFREHNGAVYTILTQDEPENSCRPAVDPMMRSLSSIYGADILGVILTGMGSDGSNGCKCIKNVGGTVLAQDQSTSVVWGMPGSVVSFGLADEVLPLVQMAPRIIEYLKLIPTRGTKPMGIHHER